MIFDYPAPRNHRRHGPKGYADYDSYRPWLRDEFTFRCVYCLKREPWGQVTSDFDIDHFLPQTQRADLGTEYLNLTYSCRRCNSVKLDQDLESPFEALTDGQIQVLPDGSVRGHSPAASRLVLQLDLNSPRMIHWRLLWIRIVTLATERDPVLLKLLVGFPNDLPDLKRLRPPGGNSRPEGIAESWAYLAREGKLPATY